MRQSIQPTYDSRETGPRYHVTSRVDDRTIVFREPIEDPFVRHTVHLRWPDLLRGLLRRRLSVTVLVDGDPDVMNDVMELDANTLVPDSTRQAEFQAGIHDAMRRMADTESDT